MALEPLSEEYNAHRKLLGKESFSGVAGALVGLKKVLGSDGPKRDHADSLDYFRKHALKTDEAAKIMEMAGLDSKATTAPAEIGVRKAACLKFLRHLYMVGGRDNQQVWVLATPKTYQSWPLGELLAVRSQNAAVRDKLKEVTEQLDATTRKRLGEAMMLGLAWAQAALIVLGNAKSDPQAMDKVKRWFDDGNQTSKELAKTISKVQAGFKKIANSLNKQLVVITDMPSLRNDPNYKLTEAFVLSMQKGSERPRTIYIEKALFYNYDISVLHDMKKNWARVLVHECTHSDAGTEDKRYAYSGIQPGVDITAAEAAVNADTWAFFSADAAGALTSGDITRALGGTGGTLKKLKKNWK